MQAIVETTGALGQGLVWMIKSCEKEAARLDPDYHGLPVSATWAANSFQAYWRQRLSIAVAEGAYIMASKLDASCVRRTGPAPAGTRL